MEQIRVALDKIAEANGLGSLSDDILIKACNNYKIKSEEFDDSYEYHIKVVKSVSDFLNEIEQDQEIIKALVPGQTKVVDGVVFIWTHTPNAKSAYDWRVYKPTGSGGLNNLAQTRPPAKLQSYVNDLFPKDTSNLKVIKSLGESTGVKLVEDANGNEFVMKKGTNTNSGHVREEYLANQLYQLLGLRTPDFELVKDGNETVLYSKFLTGAEMPKSKDSLEISKGFVVDALLANWDAYENDNILIDSAGRVVRVDNGGALRFRAHGGDKGASFGKDVNELKTLLKHNPKIASFVTEAEIQKQIVEVISKKDLVLDYLALEGEDDLKDIMEYRFEYLEKYLAKKNKVKVKISDDDMYRELTDDELDVCYQETGGYMRKTTQDEGWVFLSEICKLRGFDGLPEELDDADFDALLLDQNNIYSNRGLSNANGKTADELVKDFSQSEICFYGQAGVYGVGIYSAVNTSRKKDTSNPGYYEAWSNYAGGNHNGVLDIIIPPTANIIKAKDLDVEMKSEFFGPQYKTMLSQYNDLKVEQHAIKYKIANIDAVIEAEVKNDMHWDDKILKDYQIDIDNIDWGAKDDLGDPAYPTFEDFLENNIKKYVEGLGGTVVDKNPGHGNYVLTLPNSKNQFLFTKYQYENNSIKQKNEFTKPYSYHVKLFQNWLTKNHFDVIRSSVKVAIANNDGARIKLEDELKENSTKLNTISDSINHTKSNGSIKNKVMAEILNSSSKEFRGYYAAIKGYDVIIDDENPNGSNCDYAIILNRTKVKVRKPK